MPTWLALVLQVLVQMLLAWIKGNVVAGQQPSVVKDVEDAYEDAVRQRSAQPLRDLLKRLRGS